MNYLPNKYNISRQLKTSLHYCVRHKSLKHCNCSTNAWWHNCQLHHLKNSLNTEKQDYFTYLFTALSSSVCRSTSHKLTTLRNCWAFDTALNRVQLIARAGQRGTCRAVRPTVTTATFLNFYVSNGSVTRFSRSSEKYFIYFIDNLFLFPIVKEFSKSVNNWWRLRKLGTTLFKHSVRMYHVCMYICMYVCGLFNVKLAVADAAIFNVSSVLVCKKRTFRLGPYGSDLESRVWRTS